MGAFTLSRHSTQNDYHGIHYGKLSSAIVNFTDVGYTNRTRSFLISTSRLGTVHVDSLSIPIFFYLLVFFNNILLFSACEQNYNGIYKNFTKSMPQYSTTIRSSSLSQCYYFWLSNNTQKTLRALTCFQPHARTTNLPSCFHIFVHLASNVFQLVFHQRQMVNSL